VPGSAAAQNDRIEHQHQKVDSRKIRLLNIDDKLGEEAEMNKEGELAVAAFRLLSGGSVGGIGGF
jgi:hypothetical protein